MAQNTSIAGPLHSELLSNIVNMVIHNHLTRNQAKSLFEDVVDTLDDIPYHPFSTNQEPPITSKEKLSGKSRS